jgi:FdhE protein
LSLHYSALQFPPYLVACNILLAMDQLRASLDRRLAALAASRPDLDRAIELQRILLTRQIDLLDLFRQGGVPGVSLPPGYLIAKLTQGVPALHGEPIPLPSRVLALSTREFCELLARGGAGEAAAAIGRAIDSHTLDANALVSACLGRDQRRVRFMAAQHELSPDLAWLVAELALAPFVHLLQRRVVVGHWDRGFCPVCGSWPAIVEAIAGGHSLRCSFCAAAWPLSSYRCLYCSNEADTFVTAAPDPELPGRRVQLCGACGGYVKVLETTAAAPFPLVAIEDLASMDLDMVAIERKYMRPALKNVVRSP